MHVVQTAAVPPNHGRISRAISGWTRNNRHDESAMTAACSMCWLLDFAGERLAEHPAGDCRHGLALLAIVAVRRERLAGSGLRALPAAHRNERKARGEPLRLAVRRRVAVVVAVMHEQQRNLRG